MTEQASATPAAAAAPPIKAIQSRSIQQELQAIGEAFNLAKWPTSWNIALSLICGLLTVLNQTTIAGVGFDFPVAAQTAVTWGLAIFAWLGIGPILGPKFAAALKIPPKIMGAISVLMLIGLTVAQQGLPATWAAIVIAVVQVAGGLGFEPAYIPTLI